MYQVSAYNPRTGCIDFSWEDAQIVTGRKIDNAKDVIVGMTGSGKSEMALFLAENVARNVSRIKHRGDPDHWQEYFPYWDTLVTINKEKMLKVANGKWPEATEIVLDEIQKTGNSRDFADDDNRMFNDLWQVKRPRRWCIIGTIQEIFAQDKQSRHLYSHYFEIVPINAFYPYGINFNKPKYSRLQPLNTNSKQIWYMYNHENNVQSVLAASALCNKKLHDYYVKLRLDEEKIETDRLVDEHKKRQQIKEIREEKQLGTNDKPRCPYCKSTQLYYSEKKNITKCKGCGKIV